MRTRIRVADLIIVITIASTTLYIIPRNLPLDIGSFAALWAPATLLTIFISLPRSFTNKPMRILLLYGLVMVGILQYTLWKYMTNWNQIRILLEFYYLVVLTAIWSYYYSNRDFRGLAFLGKWAFIFIIITLITTNIALYITPTIVRDSANNADFTPFQENIYNITGAMGYSYIQAVICLIPVLVYHIKIKRKMMVSSKALTIILLAIVITELRSQVFANILVSVILLILSLLSSKNRRFSFIKVILFGMFFLAIPNSFYANRFKALSYNFAPNTVMNKKLNSFAAFIENPELENNDEIGGRAARYPLLFEALRSRPLFGNSSYDSRLNIGAGSHLYWMNRLAMWGIPGFLFFIFVLYKIFASISSQFDAGFRFYYFLSVLAVIFLGMIKAVGGREPWLMLIVVIPGLYYLALPAQRKVYRQLPTTGKLIKF